MNRRDFLKGTAASAAALPTVNLKLLEDDSVEMVRVNNELCKELQRLLVYKLSRYSPLRLYGIEVDIREEIFLRVDGNKIQAPYHEVKYIREDGTLESRLCRENQTLVYPFFELAFNPELPYDKYRAYSDLDRLDLLNTAADSFVRSESEIWRKLGPLSPHRSIRYCLRIPATVLCAADMKRRMLGFSIFEHLAAGSDCRI
ncbi:MAG: twin-arginine translocation signal domain-containing protein [Candidatus Altiarchaeales archaeon]|nr:twin-arginine translocation signal domain-containing protein [Candidatus Altiarchaeales archaeon]